MSKFLSDSKKLILSLWQKRRVQFIFALVAIAAAVIWLGFWLFQSKPAGAKYQAVFLANGQVYFGELRGEQGDYVMLSNIYYLQVNQPVQQAAQTAPAKDKKSEDEKVEKNQDIRLVKLGSEIHGPEDVMYISKSQILFYEDLKNDSRIVQAMGQFEKK